MNRLEQLLQFYKEDPQDPFNIYALALEYLKTDQRQALHFFDILLVQHPAYLPVYYSLGKYYQEQDEREKAKQLFEKGISLAASKNEHKTLRELQNALNELLYD
jgi:Tfp pilus assembly protein PilF